MDGAATKHMDEIATTTTGVALLSPNDMTPETVMSELFRPVSSALPQWEASSSQVPAYSQSSAVGLQDQPGPSHSIPPDLSQVIALHEQSTGLSFDPMTPPASDTTPQNGSGEAASCTPSISSSDCENEQPARKKRTPIPDEKKDSKYWNRRKKNNMAAKRSRELRKKKIDEEIRTAKDALQENQKLKQEIEVLKSEINSLRRLLRDANMTLSLWIRAKQSSEPASQLPPMLRNPSVSFVNFPTSSV